jgi:hypothetical protein
MNAPSPSSSVLKTTIAPGRISPVKNAPSIEDLVGRASAMLPYLRENAQATENSRRVYVETTNKFLEA